MNKRRLQSESFVTTHKNSPADVRVDLVETSAEGGADETWPRSMPEEKGLDSAKLVEMVANYEERRSKNDAILIDSITVVRDSAIVADLYLNPMFPRDTKHVIHSCTKSVMSLLVGIAIARGLIKDVDVLVLDLLDEHKAISRSADLKRLRLRDLLTMQTGLRSRDSYLYQWDGLFKMQASDDWVEFILNLPFDVDPGTRFDYSNMSSFLLSAILTKTTGMDTLSFARAHLFDPLGIRDARWEKSPQGVYIGYARMWLKPHDMAKIGLLCLRKGRWGNRQLVPARWIDESTTAHSFPKKYRPVLDANGNRDLQRTMENWVATKFIRAFSDGYGYQWWLDKRGIYAAVGVGGQYIIVVPQERMVVVFTSKLSGIDSFLPAKLLDDYVLPAIVSAGPIPASRVAQEDLAQLAGPPDPDLDVMPVSPPPPVAARISGKTFSMGVNPWQYDNFRLVFDPAKDHAQFGFLTQKNEQIVYDVGLDNVPRMTPTAEGTFAAVGAWETPDVFTIEYELVGYSNRGKWRLTLSADAISVEEHGVTGLYHYKGRVR